MKNFLKTFSLLGMLMLVVCVILGVGNVAFANGVATEIDTEQKHKYSGNNLNVCTKTG